MRSNTATTKATHGLEEERSQCGYERSSKPARSWRILQLASSQWRAGKRLLAGKRSAAKSPAGAAGPKSEVRLSAGRCAPHQRRGHVAIARSLKSGTGPLGRRGALGPAFRPAGFIFDGGCAPKMGPQLENAQALQTKCKPRWVNIPLPLAKPIAGGRGPFPGSLNSHFRPRRTKTARVSSEAGIVKSPALAVLILMTSSNLSGRLTGRVGGWS